MTETDLALLQKYEREGCEPAFAEVVQRHLNLVYSVALRRVNSPQLAEEVSQSVFLDLARNISRLKPDTVLCAWLYQVTRRTASDLMRTESRRFIREQIAHDMNTTNASDGDWEHIRPCLDESIAELEEAERAALLLRFMEGKSLREVGATIGLSDDAAQKRVSRALDKLRTILQRRGATVGAGALAVMLSTQAIQAAPIGLASGIASATVSAAVTGGSFTLTTAKIITMTTVQKSLIALTVAGALGVALYQTQRNHSLTTQLTAAQAHVDALTAERASAMAVTSAETPITNANLLAPALAQLQAENKKIASERDAAKRLADLYKELADSRDNQGITNKYPTGRHVTAALGRMVRNQFKSLNGAADKKPEEMTPEEKTAMMAASAQMLSDLAEMTQASVRLKQAKDAGGETTPRDPVDDMTVFTYGALDLNESQFEQTYNLFQRYQNEVTQQNLSGSELNEASQALLKDLNQRALAEFKQSLTPDQLKTWDSFASGQNFFGAQGLFNSFGEHSPWEKMVGL